MHTLDWRGRTSNRPTHVSVATGLMAPVLIITRQGSPLLGRLVGCGVRGKATTAHFVVSGPIRQPPMCKGAHNPTETGLELSSPLILSLCAMRAVIWVPDPYIVRLIDSAVVASRAGTGDPVTIKRNHDRIEACRPSIISLLDAILQESAHQARRLPSTPVGYAVSCLSDYQMLDMTREANTNDRGRCTNLPRRVFHHQQFVNCTARSAVDRL